MQDLIFRVLSLLVFFTLANGLNAPNGRVLQTINNIY